MATPSKPPARTPPKAGEEASDALAPAPKPKSKKGLIIGIVVAVVLLAGGGGAAWYFLSGSGGDAKGADAKGADGKAAKGKGDGKAGDAGKKPIFVPLENFTVNLQPEGGDHYLQAGIVVQVSDPKLQENLKLYMPVIRNRILIILSSKVPSELMSLDGKKKLVAELNAAVRESIPGTPEGAIEDVLLASFVIQ